MEQTYQSWLKSMNAKLKFEKLLEEEAYKIFSSGGRIVEKEVTNASGIKKRISVLEFGRYQPRMKLSRKSLNKLTIYVDEVKYRVKKKQKREKSVDK